MDLGTLLMAWGAVSLVAGVILALWLNDRSGRVWVREQLAPLFGYNVELSRVRADHEAEKAALRRAQAREKQNHEALVSELFGYIGQVTPALEAALEKLPAVQGPDKLFASMSGNMKNEVGFTLSPVLTEGAAQITALQLEAVRKLQELGLRFTLWLKTVSMEQVALAAGVNGELAVAYALQATYKDWDTKLTELPFKAALDILLGKAMARLLNEGKLDGGPYSQEMLTRVFLEARAEVERQPNDLEQGKPIADKNSDPLFNLGQRMREVFGTLEGNPPKANGRLKG